MMLRRMSCAALLGGVRLRYPTLAAYVCGASCAALCLAALRAGANGAWLVAGVIIIAIGLVRELLDL